MKRSAKWVATFLTFLLAGMAASFYLQRHLGLLDNSMTLEQLGMRVAAWPVAILIAATTALFMAQGVRADIDGQRKHADKQARDKETQREQEEQAAKKAQREFSIVLTGAQLITGLFDRTKPLPYYMTPMLEQLKPYGRRPKGVYAHANGASYIYEDEPTMERKYVLYLKQLTDNLIWPYRFPALTGQFLYKDIAKLPINQFNTLPKEFLISDSQRISAVEKGSRDPGMPEGIPIEEERVLRPPAWRWTWRYVAILNSYLRYPTKSPFNEFHLQFGHAGGYDSIANAFNFIETHPPGKNPHPLVWTLSVDGPNFFTAQTDENANDSGTLLMWSHPQADTGRKPLVFLRRPVKVIDMVGNPLKPQQVKEAIAAALTQAEVSVDEIGYLVTDFGIGKPGDGYAADIGSALAQLASDQQHAIELLMNRTDLTASLDDLGADTAGFSALCAAWAAFSKNKPSLLVGRPSPNRIDVLLFQPPPNHVPPAPDKAYYGAVAEPEFSRPWWGERLDGEPDFGDEPNKERADGGGLLAPAKPFEFTWQ